MARELDDIVTRSLRRFVVAINGDWWTGRREREAISLYVLGHLQREVRRGSVLSDVTQIGIEVPVRQIDASIQRAISGRKGTPKAEVTKDLAIWPRPRMTTWTHDGRSSHSPLVIMEWKMGRLSPSEHDVRWLEEYSRRRPRFVGYAVSLGRKEGSFAVAATRVRRGIQQPDWFVFDGRPAP